MTAPVLDDTDDFPAFEDLEAEEKPKRRTRQPRDPNAPPRTRVTSDAKLAQELLEPMAMLGQAVSFMSPTGGAVIIARGEATTTALVKFAKGHPKMLAALRNVSKVSPVADIIQTIAMVIIAIQIDVGALNPTAPMALLSGVTSIHAVMAEAMDSDDGAPAGVQFPNIGGQFEHIAPPPTVAEGYRDDGTWEAPGGFRAGASAGMMNP